MKFLTGLCAAARPMALPKGRPAHLYAGSSLCAQVRSLSVSAPVQGTARRLVYERPYERIPEQKRMLSILFFFSPVLLWWKREKAGFEGERELWLC